LDSEKPSGSLTLRNADAALGVMYVVFFEKVGSGKAADSEIRTGKLRLAFLWSAGFRVKPADHFCALVWSVVVPCSRGRVRVGLVPNWQLTPRPSPCLPLPLRRRGIANSFSFADRRTSGPNTIQATNKQFRTEQISIAESEAITKPLNHPTESNNTWKG
jgi:hypothetical protein